MSREDAVRMVVLPLGDASRNWGYVVLEHTDVAGYCFEVLSELLTTVLLNVIERSPAPA